MSPTTLLLLPLLVALQPAGEAAMLFGNAFRVNGTVYCATGPAAAGAAAPPGFPNASTQLECGRKIIARTVTNSNGEFSFLRPDISMPLIALLNNCAIIVDTPLSSCNPSLPSTGILQSTLQLLSGADGLLPGILGAILNLIAGGFSYVPALN